VVIHYTALPEESVLSKVIVCISGRLTCTSIKWLPLFQRLVTN